MKGKVTSTCVTPACLYGTADRRRIAELSEEGRIGGRLEEEDNRHKRVEKTSL